MIWVNIIQSTLKCRSGEYNVRNGQMKEAVHLSLVETFPPTLPGLGGAWLISTVLCVIEIVIL